MGNSQPYSEKELLVRIAQGDEKLFSALIRQYSSTVYSHCLAYLKSVEKAEELTQDIFLQVWRNREKLPGINSFPDYLFIISRNFIYRSFRKKVRELVALADNDDTETIQQPDLQAEYKDYYQLLMKGIELLPEKRRQVFRLSRIEGKTHEEIASIMGINKITVSQYVMLSLNFLKTYLKNHTGDSILAIILLRGLI